MITQLIYISQARDPMGSDSDVAILEKARLRNEALGLTGFLFRTRSAFLQLLEGTSEDVQQVMALIRSDTRHSGIFEWPPKTVEHRSFPDWRMGFDELLQERETEFIAELQTPGMSFEALRAHIELLAEETRDQDERLLLTVARRIIVGSDPAPGV